MLALRSRFVEQRTYPPFLLVLFWALNVVLVFALRTINLQWSAYAKFHLLLSDEQSFSALRVGDLNQQFRWALSVLSFFLTLAEYTVFRTSRDRKGAWVATVIFSGLVTLLL